jgi:hypothetical protein
MSETRGEKRLRQVSLDSLEAQEVVYVCEMSEEVHPLRAEVDQFLDRGPVVTKI